MGSVKLHIKTTDACSIEPSIKCCSVHNMWCLQAIVCFVNCKSILREERYFLPSLSVSEQHAYNNSTFLFISSTEISYSSRNRLCASFGSFGNTKSDRNPENYRNTLKYPHRYRIYPRPSVILVCTASELRAVCTLYYQFVSVCLFYFLS